MMEVSEMPVLVPIPITKRGERRRWLLKEEWSFGLILRAQDYIIPAGFIFDGASIPRIFWNILSPTGYLFLAGLIHDFIYKYSFLYTRNVYPDGDIGRIYKERYNQKGADYIFEDLANKISMDSKIFTRASLLALRGFGSFTWNRYRKENLTCDLILKDYESLYKVEKTG